MNEIKKIQEDLEKGLTGKSPEEHFEEFTNMKVTKETLDLLDEETKEIKYLDLGYNQNFFYYGFKLRGKEAIVTSERKIYRNTEEIWKGKVIGINEIRDHIDYEGYLGEIAPLISNWAIKAYVTNEADLDKQKHFQEIIDKINYYMDFGEDENIVYVQACWVIATHCYPLFYWFPHVLFNAPSESGKSKNAYILTQLSFRGYDLGASAGVTPAQIFRTLEGNRGTILIDEFEKQEKSETQQLVNQILNASCAKDAYVIRTEQIDKKWKAWKFPIFCPKIVCNITGINPTSMSRFIGFSLLKTLNRDKGSRKPYRQKDKESFVPLRDRTSLLLLENWQEIAQIYDNLKLDLLNRDEDNWLPVCAIAKWISTEVYGKVLGYISKYKDLRLENNDIEADFFIGLLNSVGDEKKYYQPKEITQWAEIFDIIGHFKSPDKWIGWKLKKYDFKHNNRAGGIKKWLLSKELVENITNRYFGTDKTTQNNNNNTEQQQQHRTTQKDVSFVSFSVVLPKEDISEETIADPLSFDKKLLVFMPCSVEGCPGTECNMGNNNKPYCQGHWQTEAAK